ncbi:restriction endonuclease subunit S [Pseudomonas peradeniyensis]|uniref:Restriction endonuclease subunit S n=1 Tax=Pseudomonas peradeniyensis TaxID=2745488 RepID=A0ABT2VGD6_9PSED|nr:restriction endonuclease subunit S [Pseudomonas peradeniyensis]MCU7240812.1 restriction endonuclease subunit S [Pseudomonas peradeniyensis]
MLAKKNRPLGELAEKITVGYVGSMASEYVDNGIPFLRSLNVRPFLFDPSDLKFVTREFHEKIKKSAISPGDVVVVRTGKPGASCVVPDSLIEANCSDLVIIRCGENLDPYFVSYYINSIVGSQVKGQLVGAIQKHFNIGSAKEIVFPDIDKSKQSEIARVLRAIDSKIDCNNRVNTELESMAKTLYDYWFSQFDFPDVNGNPYRFSGGRMDYNVILKREIPCGWTESSILAVADLLGGGTPTKKKSEYWGGDIPFFTPTDADGAIFKFLTADSITLEGLKNSSTKLFGKHTIFITARGSVGKLVLAGIDMAMNQSCYALRAKSGVSHSFLFFLTKELVHHLQVKSSGSVFDSIVSNDIELTKLAIPPIDLIERFSEFAEPVFEKIANNIKENQQLTQLRDWLLPMLMTGQVKVT